MTAICLLRWFEFVWYDYYAQATRYFRFIISPSFSTEDEVGTRRQDFCAKISDRKLGRDARVEEWDIGQT